MGPGATQLVDWNNPVAKGLGEDKSEASWVSSQKAKRLPPELPAFGIGAFLPRPVPKVALDLVLF